MAASARSWLALACVVALLAGTGAAPPSPHDWSSTLASSLREVVPRYSMDLEPVAPDFRPTHHDYLQKQKKAQKHQEAASAVADVLVGCCHRYIGLHGCRLLGRDIGHTFQPLHNLSKEVGHALDTAQGLLADSEAAYPRVLFLRDLALSLAPQVDDLHRSVDQLLDVLRRYPHARELERQLGHLTTGVIRDMPQLFPGLRAQLHSLDTLLLSPIQAPLTSLNQEITALQGVINVQAVDELQFGLFFFMSLESALLSGKPSRRIQPVILAKLQQLVNAVVADRSHNPSGVVHQAQIIDQKYLRVGKAFEAIGPVDALVQALSSSAYSTPEVANALHDVLEVLDQKLTPSGLVEARKLKSGIAFLEDRAAIDRVKESLVEKQFGAYQRGMAQVKSADVNSFLVRWRQLNTKVAGGLGNVNAHWAQYSVQFSEIRQFVDSHSELWWFYAHSTYVLLLMAFLLGSATFIFPRVLWLVIALLLVAALWCSLEMGLYLPASVAIADWCVAPEDSVVSLLREHTSDLQVESTAHYYLQCTGENVLVPSLDYASQELHKAVTELDHGMNFTLLVPSAKNVTTELMTALVDGESRLESVRRLANCSVVRTPFDQVKSAMCGDLLRGSVHLMLGRMAMVLLVSFALFSAWLALAAHANYADAVAARVPLLWIDSGEVEYLKLSAITTTDTEEEEEEEEEDRDHHCHQADEDQATSP